MSTWLPIGKIILAVVLMVIGLFYLDIRSLFLELKRNRMGEGSSGVALVALPLYACGVWLLPQYVFGIHKGYIFLVFLVLHISCHFVVPRIHRCMVKSA